MHTDQTLPAADDDTQPETPRDIGERPTLRALRIPPRRPEEDAGPATLRSVR